MATSTGNLYLDPSYTDGINGSTHSITGEVLEFGVNAFNNQTQANNALVVGGTIFVTNWGTAGLHRHEIDPWQCHHGNRRQCAELCAHLS